MKYLLSKASFSVVKKLGQERTLCAFDYDGTLSPIVEHPDQARMRDSTRILLARLSSLYPCIVISGRARADVLDKLDGVNVARVIGNHGAETEFDKKAKLLVKHWKSTLAQELDSMSGVWIEDKGLSLAIHFRQSEQKSAASRLILTAVQQLSKAYAFGGKEVINVVVAGSANKGDALAEERRRIRCEWILYTGDDDNDEAAFALGGNVVAVRIGRKQRSNANYYLRSQSEIDSLLEALIQQRKCGITV